VPLPGKAEKPGAGVVWAEANCVSPKAPIKKSKRRIEIKGKKGKRAVAKTKVVLRRNAQAPLAEKTAGKKPKTKTAAPCGAAVKAIS
jgi:hypothetical protein